MPFRHADKIGDKCSNSPWITYFSCPNCYADIHACDCEGYVCSCGATLTLETEDHPVAVATITHMDGEG